MAAEARKRVDMSQRLIGRAMGMVGRPSTESIGVSGVDDATESTTKPRQEINGITAEGQGRMPVLQGLPDADSPDRAPDTGLNPTA